MAYVHERCLYQWFAMAPTVDLAQKCECCGYQYARSNVAAVRCNQTRGVVPDTRQNQNNEAGNHNNVEDMPYADRHEELARAMHRRRRYLRHTPCKDIGVCLISNIVLLGLSGTLMRFCNCRYIQVLYDLTCTYTPFSKAVLETFCYGLIIPFATLLTMLMSTTHRPLLAQLAKENDAILGGSRSNTMLYTLILLVSVIYQNALLSLIHI